MLEGTQCYFENQVDDVEQGKQMCLKFHAQMIAELVLAPRSLDPMLKANVTPVYSLWGVIRRGNSAP